MQETADMVELSESIPAKVEEGVGLHVEEDGEQLVIGETVETSHVILRKLTSVHLQGSFQ